MVAVASVAVVYADDLNVFKVYPRNVDDDVILGEIASVQERFHGWGEANQATFDPSKESQHIICSQRPHGSFF